MLNSPLFRLSRTIRHEALSQLFKNKRLYFFDFYSTAVFLEYVGDTGEQYIEDIIVLVHWKLVLDPEHPDFVAADKAIARLKALKRLTFKMRGFEVVDDGGHMAIPPFRKTLRHSSAEIILEE
ncbi:hypothetical protein N0V90_003321 [Kalmusia sp. IMI 367209]|nr:hypothetical protein N0V90_003321 [Kalmusia sp. IMI 367209]